MSIRESLDSHEDELLEDLATYSEELIIKETKQIDESVVSLANDLIDNIGNQEFDDDDDSDSDNAEDNVKTQKESKTPTTSGGENEEEDLDFQLQLSEDEDELEGLSGVMEENLFEEPPAPHQNETVSTIYFLVATFLLD